MSVRKFMIVGLKAVSAGKTTVARALLLSLRERGMEARVFKPKAGNSLWYDYDIVKEALARGRLYGEDARLLKEASSGNLSEELVNPIHRLWAIPSRSSPRFGDRPPLFVLDRVSLWAEDQRDIVVVNDDLPIDHREQEMVAGLLRNAEEVFHVSTVKELNEVIMTYYDGAVEAAHERITRDCDALVYESYEDIALPWHGIKDLDAVLAVQPGEIHLYDPDRYMMTLDLSQNLTQEENTDRVSQLLDPIDTLVLLPRPEKQVVEKTKERLQDLLGF